MRRPEGKRIEAKPARRLLAGLLVVAAALIGAVALLSDDSDHGSGESSTASGHGAVLSASELVSRVAQLDRPVYWVGPRTGTSGYELTVTPDERVYVRYLTGDAGAGDPRADYLTVGTYPVGDAAQALQDATTESASSQTLKEHTGYEVLGSPENTNAYLVFNDHPDLQIEIYSPRLPEAIELADGGGVMPIE